MDEILHIPKNDLFTSNLAHKKSGESSPVMTADEISLFSLGIEKNPWWIPLGTPDLINGVSVLFFSVFLHIFRDYGGPIRFFNIPVKW